MGAGEVRLAAAYSCCCGQPTDCPDAAMMRALAYRVLGGEGPEHHHVVLVQQHHRSWDHPLRAAARAPPGKSSRRV